MSDLNFTLLATAPFPELRYLRRIIYRGGRIWCYYGYKTLTAFDANDVSSSADGISWTNHGNLPPTVYNYPDSPNTPFGFPPNAVIIGNQSGFGGASVFSSLNGYSGFSVVPSNFDFPAPVIRKWGASTVHGGYAFFGAGSLGSTGGGPLKDVWRSSDLAVWTRVTDLPSGGDKAQFFSFSDSIVCHVTGRIYKSTDLGMTWVEQTASLPTPNRIGWSCAYNDMIIAEEVPHFDSGLGSYVSDGKFWLWRQATGAWTELSQNYGDGLYHFGGYWESLIAANGKVYRFAYSSGPTPVHSGVSGTHTALNKVWVSDFPTFPPPPSGSGGSVGGDSGGGSALEPMMVPLARASGAGVMSPPYSRLMPGSTGSISHARILKGDRTPEKAQYFHETMKESTL